MGTRWRRNKQKNEMRAYIPLSPLVPSLESLPFGCGPQVLSGSEFPCSYPTGLLVTAVFCCSFRPRDRHGGLLTWVPVASLSINLLSVQFSSVAQSCPTLCDPMNHSMPGLRVHQHLPEFTQTHIHWVGDAIQPSHPLSSPFPPAPNLSQHQGLFQWINSSHEVAKVLEFQL